MKKPVEQINKGEISSRASFMIIGYRGSDLSKGLQQLFFIEFIRTS
tara:strand:+ start:177 stop:314 length:138 start_codon:yes stop_codon:yes gene_type:complete